MADGIERYYGEMAGLGSPSGAEAPLRDFLAQALGAQGARTEVDAVGNLLARKGDGGRLLLLGLDEPTFLPTGSGPGGRGLAPSATGMGQAALVGRMIQAGEKTALLHLEKDELTFDPLGARLEVGEAAVFTAPRRRSGDALLGPGAGRRALIAASLQALSALPAYTLIGLSRAGFSPTGGADLLRAARRPQGVALDVLDEDDGNEIGCGPLVLARGAGYAAPARIAALWGDGVTFVVRPEVRTLAAKLQPAGIDGLALGLLARYGGGDLERIAYQDAAKLADLLREALGPS